MVKGMGAVVVGTGFGCRVHVPAARAAGLEVVALVGRDEERVRRRAERCDVARACTSLAEALRVPGADAVIIATPPDTHAELAEEVIAAGRHVLLEKPFTTTVVDARTLADAARRSGVVALVGHEFRFAPERAAVLRALREGVIGEPKLALFLWHLPLAAPLDLVTPPWWFDRAQGGGWLFASVSHIVDGIRCWLGEFDAVSSVLPLVSGRDPATTAEDTVAARFRMASGCEGVLQQSGAVWGEPMEMLRVAGERGTLTIDHTGAYVENEHGRRELSLADGPPVAIGPSSDPRHRFTHLELGPASMQAAVFGALAAGEVAPTDVPPATFDDGLACMEVMDAMRRSSAEDGALTCVP